MDPRNKPTTTVLLNWLSVEPFQHGFSAMHASWERERTEAIWPTLEVISQHLWYHMGYKQVMGATILKGRQRTLGHKHQTQRNVTTLCRKPTNSISERIFKRPFIAIFSEGENATLLFDLGGFLQAPKAAAQTKDGWHSPGQPIGALKEYCLSCSPHSFKGSHGFQREWVGGKEETDEGKWYNCISFKKPTYKYNFPGLFSSYMCISSWTW